MEKNDIMLCEIIYEDNLSELTSVIGRISKYQIKEFKDNEYTYIWFQEPDHPMIPKDNIREIITYQVRKIYVKNKQSSNLYHTTEKRFGAAIT